jgi:predicted acyltransferase
MENVASARLHSLDAFRGATIALMVLVNTAGDGRHVYAPLEHAEWHGWTPTDVVFPSFLWIVGVALTLSLGKRLAQGVPRSQLFVQVLRRALILYCLGLFLYGFPEFDLATWRLLGVLQRIAICYAAAAGIYLITDWRARIACIFGLLTTYWALMLLVPVPGYGAGNLDVERNLAHYVDRIVLGAHNYAHTKTWDPEGILSTLPALATALLGVLCGEILRLRRELSQRAVWLILGGGLLITAGLICDHWLPINKKLWTSSFALFMAGLDFVLFAGFLWVIDGLKLRRWARPLEILGMNAIAIYMLSEMIDPIWSMLGWRASIYRTIAAPFTSPYNASLAYAVCYTLLMFAIAWVMYRRNWFLKV